MFSYKIYNPYLYFDYGQLANVYYRCYCIYFEGVS
jgi:hypothetical protein